MNNNNAGRIMEQIYDMKKFWTQADKSDDEAGRQAAARQAQHYYDLLRKNGYEPQAQKLYDSGLDDSRKYIDNFYALSGKSAIRPYLYNKGSQHGMTNADIDKLLSFNETTGEVTFGGKNIGRPATISSDGISYWDNGDLDNIWNDYAANNNVTLPLSTTAKQQTDKLFNMSGEWNDINKKDYQDYMKIVNENPFATDAGNAIMQRYGLMGFTGRQNALANGASSNGGNVDSYSAANAMRQQMALNAQGQQAVMDMHNARVQGALNSNTKLENARALLQQMGVQINDATANNETLLNGEVDRQEKLAQGEFDREQTRLNNEVDRQEKTAQGEFDRTETALNNRIERAASEGALTGYTPRSISLKNNPYLFDENGNAKDLSNIDFGEMIENLRKIQRTTDDVEQKERLEKSIKQALEAGFYKVTLPQFSQYANTWAKEYGDAMSYEPQRTEDAAFGREQLESAERQTDKQYEQERAMEDIKSKNKINEGHESAKDTMAIDNNSSRLGREEAAFKNALTTTTSGTSGTSGSSGTSSSSKSSSSSSKSSSSSGSSSKSSTSSSSSSGNSSLTDEKVYEVFTTLNKQAKEVFGSNALEMKTGGTYNTLQHEFVANRILTMDGLSLGQRTELLNLFNVHYGAIEDVLTKDGYVR